MRGYIFASLGVNRVPDKLQANSWSSCLSFKNQDGGQLIVVVPKTNEEYFPLVVAMVESET